MSGVKQHASSYQKVRQENGTTREWLVGGGKSCQHAEDAGCVRSSAAAVLVTIGAMWLVAIVATKAHGVMACAGSIRCTTTYRYAPLLVSDHHICLHTPWCSVVSECAAQLCHVNGLCKPDEIKHANPVARCCPDTTTSSQSP
jgi:hypothetical protein